MDNQDISKETICAMLYRHISQRPGLEWGNYGDSSTYRAESRRITRQLADARQLLRAVELSGITAAALKDAFRGAYSGRLSLEQRADGKWALSYCTGQYWPTEYRAAACAVLSAALWSYKREQCMPAPIAHTVHTWKGEELTSAPVGIHEACEVVNANGGRDKCHIENLYRDGNGRPRFTAGDWLRWKFRQEFGRHIQQRWFN